MIADAQLKTYRITPARAGNRNSWTPPYSSAADHPRACGEQALGHYLGWQGGGSPPRVRGTDGAEPQPRKPQGITPARAGNSPEMRSPRSPTRDHPRACGEQGLTCIPLLM